MPEMWKEMGHKRGAVMLLKPRNMLMESLTQSEKKLVRQAIKSGKQIQTYRRGRRLSLRLYGARAPTEKQKAARKKFSDGAKSHTITAEWRRRARERSGKA